MANTPALGHRKLANPPPYPGGTLGDSLDTSITLWQTQLNFAVFCASSACGVSVEHMNAKKSIIRSIYHFHVYYHIRRILKILQIPLSYDNTFHKYNNPYSCEMFMKIYSEYGVSNDLIKWRNQRYFTT